MKKLSMFALFAAMNLAAFSASAGERTFYWTGQGFGYDAAECYAAAQNDGYWQAVASCSRDHGMNPAVCENGFVSSKVPGVVISPYNPYTGTCSYRVFVDVTF